MVYLGYWQTTYGQERPFPSRAAKFDAYDQKIQKQTFIYEVFFMGDNAAYLLIWEIILFSWIENSVQLKLSEYMYKLVPLLFLIYSNQVLALSCSRFEDLFIAEWSTDGCGEILYIKKIGAFGPCSRKPTIAQPPGWAIDVLEYEVNNLEPTEKPILYELRLRKSAWNEYFGFQSIEQYRKDRTTKDQQPIYFGGISQ